MAMTKQNELAEALRLAKAVEELAATNPNCGEVIVQTAWGRQMAGWSALMDFIEADVQARFDELRTRAIDEARARYETAMQALEEGE